jgi:hypothetical protein
MYLESCPGSLGFVAVISELPLYLKISLLDGGPRHEKARRQLTRHFLPVEESLLEIRTRRIVKKCNRQSRR